MDVRLVKISIYYLREFHTPTFMLCEFTELKLNLR